jgi:TonB family protein
MNLAQYRLKAAVQGRHRLWLCVAAAGMLHLGAIALVFFNLRLSPEPNASIPLQFVPLDQPDSRPSASSLHAAVNASPSIQSLPEPAGITRSLSVSPVLPIDLKALQPAPSVANQSATKDKVWGAYLTQLRRQIYRQWQATSLMGDRSVKVRFVIARRGQLMNLELLQSSSDATTDQGAIAAVQAAAPFAPLPSASKEDRLRVTFTFDTP